MKTFKTILIALLAVVSVSSCMKDDNTYDDSYEKEIARRDSIFKDQKDDLEAYAAEHFGENKKFDEKSGIWYEVLEPATEPADFEYTIRGNGYLPVKATVKYKGYLMDGTVFDEKLTDPVSMDIYSTNTSSIFACWIYAFYPKTTDANMQFSGLVEKGLRAGNKIRFISSSIWAQDNKGNEKLPANVPVVFEITVNKVENAM